MPPYQKGGTHPYLYSFIRVRQEISTREAPRIYSCGFPTETDEDFQATLRLIDQFVLLRVQVYKFDPKPGTDAAKMQGQIPDGIKDQRYQDAKQLIKNNYRRFMMRRVLHLVKEEGHISPPDTLKKLFFEQA